MGNKKRARQKANKAHNSKSDEDSQSPQKKSKNSKWNISYSKMTIPEAEKRLGVRLDEIKAVAVDRVLAEHRPEEMEATKETVYDWITRYLDIEGYPTEASAGFKEAKVSDLVYSTIGPILSDFKRRTKRNIRLEREKEIISKDEEIGGMEEFVVMDRISVTEEKFVLIIEAKRSSTGQAMKQIMLSLKDAWDNNMGGVIYGFVTTGQVWQMLRYDGSEFVKTNEFTVLFDTMGEEKEKWMKENSVVVDCVVVALSNGGIVWKDVVVSAG